MYEVGTILVLKEPKGTEDKPFPYDRVKVIGASPIHHGVHYEEWSGTAGDGVIIQPDGEAFGSTLDEPFGKLQEMYDIEFVPETVVDVVPQVRVIKSNSNSAGPSPEEVFAGVAKERGEEKTEKRARTLRSPLDGDPSPEEREEVESRVKEIKEQHGK